MSKIDEAAALGRSLMDGAGRYHLVVFTEDRKDTFVMPLALEGDESAEQAMSQFTDAIVVSRQAMAKRDQYQPSGGGIDGKPRTEREKGVAAVIASEIQKHFGPFA